MSHKLSCLLLILFTVLIIDCQLNNKLCNKAILNCDECKDNTCINCQKGLSKIFNKNLNITSCYLSQIKLYYVNIQIINNKIYCFMLSIYYVPKNLSLNVTFVIYDNENSEIKNEISILLYYQNNYETFPKIISFTSNKTLNNNYKIKIKNIEFDYGNKYLLNTIENINYIIVNLENYLNLVNIKTKNDMKQNQNSIDNDTLYSVTQYEVINITSLNKYLQLNFQNISYNLNLLNKISNIKNKTQCILNQYLNNTIQCITPRKKNAEILGPKKLIQINLNDKTKRNLLNPNANKDGKIEFSSGKKISAVIVLVLICVGSLLLIIGIVVIVIVICKCRHKIKKEETKLNNYIVAKSSQLSNSSKNKEIKKESSSIQYDSNLAKF